MSSGIRLPYYKTHLPGGIVAVLAASYGRRVGYRADRLDQARKAEHASTRALMVKQAWSWHKLAMQALRELREAAK